jgi:hypothetical protein
MRDVGMIQCGQRLRFALEASEAIGIVGNKKSFLGDNEVMLS